MALEDRIERLQTALAGGPVSAEQIRDYQRLNIAMLKDRADEAAAALQQGQFEAYLKAKEASRDDLMSNLVELIKGQQSAAAQLAVQKLKNVNELNKALTGQSQEARTAVAKLMQQHNLGKPGTNVQMLRPQIELAMQGFKTSTADQDRRAFLRLVASEMNPPMTLDGLEESLMSMDTGGSGRLSNQIRQARAAETKVNADLQSLRAQRNEFLRAAEGIPGAGALVRALKKFDNPADALAQQPEKFGNEFARVIQGGTSKEEIAERQRQVGGSISQLISDTVNEPEFKRLVDKYDMSNSERRRFLFQLVNGTPDSLERFLDKIVEGYEGRQDAEFAQRRAESPIEREVMEQAPDAQSLEEQLLDDGEFDELEKTIQRQIDAEKAAEEQEQGAAITADSIKGDQLLSMENIIAAIRVVGKDAGGIENVPAETLEYLRTTLQDQANLRRIKSLEEGAEDSFAAEMDTLNKIVDRIKTAEEMLPIAGGVRPTDKFVDPGMPEVDEDVVGEAAQRLQQFGDAAPTVRDAQDVYEPALKSTGPNTVSGPHMENINFTEELRKNKDPQALKVAAILEKGVDEKDKTRPTIAESRRVALMRKLMGQQSGAGVPGALTQADQVSANEAAEKLKKFKSKVDSMVAASPDTDDDVTRAIKEKNKAAFRSPYN